LSFSHLIMALPLCQLPNKVSASVVIPLWFLSTEKSCALEFRVHQQPLTFPPRTSLGIRKCRPAEGERESQWKGGVLAKVVAWEKQGSSSRRLCVGWSWARVGKTATNLGAALWV
jgi:hypothetical protein